MVAQVSFGDRLVGVSSVPLVEQPIPTHASSRRSSGPAPAAGPSRRAARLDASAGPSSSASNTPIETAANMVFERRKASINSIMGAGSGAGSGTFIGNLGSDRSPAPAAVRRTYI